MAGFLPRLLFLLVVAASVLSQLSIGRVLSFVPYRMLIQVCLYFYCKFLWRCMKFVMRKLTGRCELQRICYGTKPGASRTMKIGERQAEGTVGFRGGGIGVAMHISISNIQILIERHF